MTWRDEDGRRRGRSGGVQRRARLAALRRACVVCAPVEAGVRRVVSAELRPWFVKWEDLALGPARVLVEPCELPDDDDRGECADGSILDYSGAAGWIEIDPDGHRHTLTREAWITSARDSIDRHQRAAAQGA